MKRLIGTAALGLFLAVGAVQAQTLGPDIRAQDRLDPQWGDPEAGRELVLVLGCIDCHGLDGIGRRMGIPNLAGQKEVYLLKQVLEFRESARGTYGRNPMGGRHHPMMDQMVKDLERNQLRHLVAYYADLSCPASGKRPKPAPEIVARCRMCHGYRGLSHRPTIPNLVAQDQIYLMRELESFRRTDENRNWRNIAEEGRYHPLMDKQAHRLSDTEIILAAGYFASQSCD